jgi:aryl sulfotransferase
VIRTIWLASYPKSGNTWFRMMVANLSATDAPADINNLPERGGIASARVTFDYLTLIDSGLLTFEEADALRPRVYEELARGEEDDEYDQAPESPPVRLVKVHDAYTHTAGGEPVLAGGRGAQGAILMVRDPRDVAASFANHNRSSLDEAIAFMANRDSAFCAKPLRQDTQLRQRLLDWSGHAQSWLEQSDIPVHLVRYEDLQSDTIRVFARALAFAGRTVSEEQIARAVAFSHFDELRRQEAEKGFAESPRSPGGQFFRKGEAGGWRTELTPAQVGAIEAVHAPMMQRLGYELAGAHAPETAGEAA